MAEGSGGMRLEYQRMTETLTPSRLWKSLTLDQRERIARAFWLDEEAVEDQLQAALLIAQQKKFRPKTVVSLDVDRKARHLATLGSVPDSTAARALVVYHLAEQRPMMGAFLDALGIKHEEGIIAEEEVTPPTTDALKQAARTLAASYPGEDVSLYLSTLVWQDPDTWGPLADLPETKPRETTNP